MADQQTASPEDWDKFFGVQAGAAQAPAATPETTKAPAAAAAPASEEDWDKFFGVGQKKEQTGSSAEAEASKVPQDTSAWRPVKIAGSALVHGAESFLGTPGDLQKWANVWLPEHAGGLGNLLTNPHVDWKHPLAPRKDGDPGAVSFPTTEDVEKAFGTKGWLTSRPDLEPQTTGEKFINAIGEGVGAAGPFALAGAGRTAIKELTREGTKVLPKVAGDVAKEVGTASFEGAGAGAAIQGVDSGIGPDAPAWAKPAAAVAGALTGHMALGASRYMANAKNLADAVNSVKSTREQLADLQSQKNTIARAPTPAANALTDFNQGALVDLPVARAQQAVDAAQRAHDSTLQPAIDASKQMLEGEHQALDASHQVLHDHANAALNNIADLHHPDAQSIPAAGRIAQEHATNWISGGPDPARPLPESLPGQLRAHWDPIDREAAQVPVPTDSTFTALRRLAGDPHSQIRDTLALLRRNNALPERLATRLDNALDPTSSGELAPLSWADARQLRTAVGAQVRNPAMAELYGAVTNDMRSGLEAAPTSGSAPAGQASLLDRFNNANAESRRLYELRDGPIADIAKVGRDSLSENKYPENIATTLIGQAQKGGTGLNAIRGQIEDAVNALASAHIRSLADDPQAWHNLDAEGQAALVPDAELRRQITGITQDKLDLPEIVKTRKAEASAEHSDRVQAITDSMVTPLKDAKANNQLVKTQRTQGYQQAATAESRAREAASNALAERMDRLREQAARETAVQETQGNLVAAAIRRLGPRMEFQDLARRTGETLGGFTGIPGARTIGGIGGTLLYNAAPSAGRALKKAAKNPDVYSANALGGLALNANDPAPPLTIHRAGTSSGNKLLGVSE